MKYSPEMDDEAEKGVLHEIVKMMTSSMGDRVGKPKSVSIESFDLKPESEGSDMPASDSPSPKMEKALDDAALEQELESKGVQQDEDEQIDEDEDSLRRRGKIF